MTPREEAIAYLKSSLEGYDEFIKDHPELSTTALKTCRVIKRLVDNADYVGPVLDKLFSSDIDEENRRKNLDRIISAARYIGPEKAKRIRDARKKLKASIKKFQKNAKELSILIRDIKSLGYEAELDMPAWIGGATDHAIDETIKNSKQYECRIEAHKRDLDRWQGDFDPQFDFRPRFYEVLEQVSAISIDHAKPKYKSIEKFVSTRQNSPRDFLIVLNHVLNNRRIDINSEVFNPLADAVFESITSTDIAVLGTVLLGLDQEINPDSASPRKLKKRLKPDT